ncbi:MAG TPA: metallophosphoesterase [bacterium (Candidatus Stahlbacteria)]|nr:metallophosphoesterase [Candidatus Stahlbacteria bacterium]
MRIGIISDIHSNLEALNKVLAEIAKEGVEEVWCLGDVVGYGADPNECVDLVRDRCRVCIGGNHDWASIGKTDITYFNPVAKAAVLWTKDELTEANIRFLEQLDLEWKDDRFLLVHATPSAPDKWHYLFDRAEYQKEFDHFKETVCFIGHSHIPGFVDDRLKLHYPPLDLDPKSRYIINVGSVGQPRDGDPRASFAIVDNNRIELRRVGYDVDKTREKILKAGLPVFLAERLMVGR